MSWRLFDSVIERKGKGDRRTIHLFQSDDSEDHNDDVCGKKDEIDEVLEIAFLER